MKTMFSPKKEKEDDTIYSSESVEINADSVLPLHAQDGLRSYYDNPSSNVNLDQGGMHRTSSSNSLTYANGCDTGIERNGLVNVPEDDDVNPSNHSLPSPEEATGDLEVNTKAVTNAATGDDGEEKTYSSSRRRLRRTVIAVFCLLLLAAAVIAGVFIGTKGDDDGRSSIDENKVIIDIDNPNVFPPTPTPVTGNPEDGNDFPYFPGTQGEDPPPEFLDLTNYCPLMKGAIVANLTKSVVLRGITDNTTVIGANNNPNATFETQRMLPSCQDNTFYGRGLWFTVRGPGAVVRASTCLSLGLTWEDSGSNIALPLDTQLTVFTSQTSTCADGLTCVTGNDDASCGTQSIVSWYAEKDRLYYIFASGKPTGIVTDVVEGALEENSVPITANSGVSFPVGRIGLTLELAPIGSCDAAIDYQTEAVAVSRVVMDPGQQTQVPTASSLIVGTLLGAKNFGIDPCLDGQWLGRGGEIWYRVTGTGRWIVASTCSSKSTNEFPPRLRLYKGNCDRLECAVAKVSDFAPSVDRDCGFGYSLNWWAQLGEEYYIMVYKTNLLPGVQFGLTVEDLNPPSNDNCTGATSLFADGTVTYGSTLRATYTPEQIAPTCIADDVTHSHPGVWYRVLGTGTRLTASLCDEVTEYDTKISVYEGSCGNLRCVIANDQWCGYQSSVYWESISGTMYYILVHGSIGGTSASMGDFGLSIFEFKPSINDYCTDAILVRPGSVTRGSTSTASADEYIESCDYTSAASTNKAPGVWYKVIGTGIGMRASTCGGETTFDTRISIYRGEDCQQLSCVISDDNGCGFQSSAYWHSIEGETYYILVTGNLFSSFGDFTLSVQNYRPTTINDFCYSAISASTTTVNLGSTKNATFDGVEKCVVANSAPGIWYKVVGSGTGMVASTCHLVTDFDTRISVFRGSDCDRLECVAGNDDSHQSSDCGSSAGSRVSWLSTLGQEYHILVHGWGALVGTFGLTIEEVVPLVANDFCITSSDIQVSVGSEITTLERVTFGTNIDATVDNVPVCGDVESTGHGIWYRSVGTGNRLVASTCNEVRDERDNVNVLFSTLTPGVVTDFDTQISVFRGGCRTLQCLGANNDRCGLQSSVNFFVDQGEVFYVLVHGSGDSKGSFGLVIEEIFPQVANDFCDMALPFAIAAGGGTNQLLGSTLEASYDTVEECVVKNTAPGVWYRTTGTGQRVTVTTCGDQTDFDTRLSIYTGDCQSLECVTGNDDTSRNATATCGLASTASWLSIQGQTYYIRVHGWGSLTGNFLLSVFETEAP